ncbi:hypothetical protein ACFFX0_01530 [Citricoccus parietis]|uniref:Uncharacterized protein n=1 Tax=Citricoccus parietis TaxID=592307 RepID=A0ABV5FTD4_9MICC
MTGAPADVAAVSCAVVVSGVSLIAHAHKIPLPARIRDRRSPVRPGPRPPARATVPDRPFHRRAGCPGRCRGRRTWGSRS